MIRGRVGRFIGVLRCELRTGNWGWRREGGREGEAQGRDVVDDLTKRYDTPHLHAHLPSAFE